MKLELSFFGETGRIDLTTLQSILVDWQKVLSQHTKDKCTLTVETIIANGYELKVRK